MLGGATIRDCVRNALAGGIVITPDLLGIVSGLTSGVAYAVLIILARALTQRFNPYALVFIQNCVIVLLLLPFVRTFPFEKWWIFAFMGLMHSTVAPFLYYRGLKDVKANSTAILGYFEPVGAIVLSIIFLRELPDIKVFLGGIFILVSGYLTISQRKLPVDEI
jgi:drug/metabolite transporter (DMT)-like permease